MGSGVIGRERLLVHRGALLVVMSVRCRSTWHPGSLRRRWVSSVAGGGDTSAAGGACSGRWRWRRSQEIELAPWPWRVREPCISSEQHDIE